MPKTLNLKTGQAFTIERPIPYVFTVNNVDESSDTYAADASGTVEKDDSWITINDEAIFSSDNFLLQLGSA